MELESWQYFETMTVHEPHPPSPHPNFVPVKCTASEEINILIPLILTVINHKSTNIMKF